MLDGTRPRGPGPGPCPFIMGRRGGPDDSRGGGTPFAAGGPPGPGGLD